MADTCPVCEGGVEGELTCVKCELVCHFSCILGCEVNNPKTRSSIKKGNFLCPICIVSRRDDLTISAMRGNQQLHRENDINFARPATPLANGATAEQVAEEQEDEEEAAEGDQGTEQRDAPETPPPQTAGPGATDPTQTAPNPVLRLRDGVNGEVDGDDSASLPHSQGSRRGDGGDRDFRQVMPQSEFRRVKRCKGTLFGLKHLPPTVETLIILDSNGRGIKGEDIDGSGAKVSVKAIGGLCVSATTAALKEAKLVFPKIKNVAFGLGTNDHLHRGLHPGEKEPYIKDLDAAARKTFPSATIHFILPFTAIKGLTVDYIKSIAADIKASRVNWKVHFPPNMKGKLASPQYIHIKPEDRVVFSSWLKKVFKPRGAEATISMPSPIVTPSPVVPSSNVLNNFRVQNIARDQTSDRAAGKRLSNQPVLPPSGELDTNKLSLDSLLKDKLLELVLGQTSVRPRMRPPPWQYIDY